MDKKAKNKKAVALLYRHGQDHVPKVVAKGSGLLAERIIAVARANWIPCVENQALVQALARLELDTEIPTELYLAVAQVLAFVYDLDRQKGTAD